MHWDSARCIHTGICLRTLPQAFDVRRRPWVDIHAADADAVADAVSRCPTGALRYERLDGASGDEPDRPTLVVPIPDGPLMLRGDLDIRDADGEQISRENRVTLCRCGRSRNQPFCDGSHEKAGFRSQPSETAHERLEAESPAAFTPNRQVPDPEQLES